MDEAKRPLRIAIVFPGDSSNPSTWSGTPYGVGEGLRDAGVDVIHLSSTVPARGELLLASLVALRYLPSVKRGSTIERVRGAYRSALISPGLVRIRSIVARRRLARTDLDGCIQIGASLPLRTSAPVVTFEDMTVRQALNYPYDHWSTLRRRDVDWRVEGQGRAYRAARACCVTNSWARRSVIEDYGVDPGKVHVVGVGTNHAPRQVERDWSRPRFLFVGREWERKNGPAVLRAFARLRDTLPHDLLHLVGEHPLVDAPGVVDHGPLRQDIPDERKRLRALFDSATCFVMPSLFEPSAIVYTEAAAAGIPSVGTLVGGSQDLIGDGGIAVDPHSEQEILSAMEKFADPPVAREYGARAGARCRLFVWQQVAERLLRALAVRNGDRLAEFLPATPEETPHSRITLA